jgi:hypothetical protein
MKAISIIHAEESSRKGYSVELFWGTWIAQYSDGLLAEKLRNQDSIPCRGKRLFPSL